MTKRSVYMYITASLLLIVPAPGRFAVGIVLVLELNVLMVAGLYARYVLSLLHIDEIKEILLIMFLIFLTMFCRQLLTLLIPEAALQLGYVIYLPAVSSYSIGCMFGTKVGDLSGDVYTYMSHTLLYSIFALLFFLFRDVIGFGTFSYPTLSGINEIVLFDSEATAVFSFFATIPGALICMGIILIGYNTVTKKLQIVKRSLQ